MSDFTSVTAGDAVSTDSGAQVNPTAPRIRTLTWPMIREALDKGWHDFLAAPGYGAFFGGFYVVCGMIMALVTKATGEYYWLALMVFGFPLLGPFAALGFYEVSRRLEYGEQLNMREILGVVWHEREGQIPWLIAIIVLVFMFWSFIGHMIFALFLGLTTMTNIMTSYEVFWSANGLMMLGFGSVVGAVLAGVLYGISVVALPLLMDRDVDFITAMIASFQTCLQNPVAMGKWALTIVGLTFVGMMPMFIGLLVVLPVLGHTTWHIYRAALD